MGRIIRLLLLPILAGCSAAASLVAIPGYFVDEVAYQFKGAERSFPLDIEHTLAAVQRGLREVRLDLDLIERHAGNYALLFGNRELDGKLLLRADTPALSTIYVQVHRGLKREDAIEQAILDSIAKHAGDASSHVRLAGFHPVYARPSRRAPTLGWFRPRARLEVHRSQASGWLIVSLPSGRKGYIRARIGRTKSGAEG